MFDNSAAMLKLLGRMNHGGEKIQFKHTIKNIRNLCRKSKWGKATESYVNPLYLRGIKEEEERIS